MISWVWVRLSAAQKVGSLLLPMRLWMVNFWLCFDGGEKVAYYVSDLKVTVRSKSTGETRVVSAIVRSGTAMGQTEEDYMYQMQEDAAPFFCFKTFLFLALGFFLFLRQTEERNRRTTAEIENRHILC